MNKYVMCLAMLLAINTTANGADLKLIEAVKARDTQSVRLLLKDKL